MKLVVNGEEKNTPEGITIQALLTSLEIDDRTVVVECNGNIYSQNEFATVVLNDKDKLEIVYFLGGG